MVQGKVEETRSRGRSPKRWLERNGGKLLKIQHETNIGSRRFKHEAND